MKTVKLTVWNNPAYMKANDRERMVAYLCEYEGKCPMYEQGKCICEDLIIGDIRCPHSKRVAEFGLTKRANGFGRLASKWRETYKTDIQISNDKMCVCGDYVFLPYAHLDVYGDKAFAELERDHFVKKELFDIPHIRAIICHRPRSLMGGIIERYEREQVPKFIQHLSEVFPELYDEYLEKYPEDRERFDQITRCYIGRTAMLHTLNDGAVYIDCHRNRWVKDGEWLVCNEYSTWLAVGKAPRKCMQQIVGDEKVEVRSNDDVSENTVFVD